MLKSVEQDLHLTDCCSEGSVGAAEDLIAQRTNSGVSDDRHPVTVTVQLTVAATHIDHSIGSDAEEGGSLVDCLDLLPSLHRDLQPLEFTEGALQGRPVLRDQVVARAEVIELADQYLQRALNLAAVRLGCRLLVPRVIWRVEVRGHTHHLEHKTVNWTCEYSNHEIRRQTKMFSFGHLRQHIELHSC